MSGRAASTRFVRVKWRVGASENLRALLTAQVALSRRRQARVYVKLPARERDPAPGDPHPLIRVSFLAGRQKQREVGVERSPLVVRCAGPWCASRTRGRADGGPSKG